MSPILLDTHVAVWSASGTLTGAAAELIDAAVERGELLLSPITAWEIGVLVRKRRLHLTGLVQDYVRGLFEGPGVVVAALTPSIAVAATTLSEKFRNDPADRILIATAEEYGAQFVTRDKEILEYAKATKHLRCVRC